MSRIIEAKAVISAEDRTGAVFDKIGKKFANLGKGAKVSAEVDKLTKSLDRMASQGRAVDQFNRNLDGFKQARARFRDAQAAVEGAARAMAKAEKPTREMQRGLDKARTAASQASREFERQRDAVVGAKRALAEFGKPVIAMRREQAGLASAIDRTASAIERQVKVETAASRTLARGREARDILRAKRADATARSDARLERIVGLGREARDLKRQKRADASAAEDARLSAREARRVGFGRDARDTLRAKRGETAAAREARFEERRVYAAERRAARREAVGTVAAGGGVLAAHKVAHGAHQVIETYREFDKEKRFAQAVMGISDAEMAPLVDQAIHLGGSSKFNDVQVLEAQRELSARGLKADQVRGLIEPAAHLGQALDLKLPDAVQKMEAALFGFKKPMGTMTEALASAKQTADVQVKAAKISGMKAEDIEQVYSYAAQPARMAGLSEQTMLAFGAMSKKANIKGDVAGTAFRALVANALSPTRGAKEAMLANGMDYKNYQKMPERIDEAAFTKTVAAQYGVKLNKKARGGLGKIFGDKAMIADPAKFTPAVMGLLEDALDGDDAKSKKSIAGLANRFRDKSMKGVDTDRLVQDLMKAIPQNPALANAIFGSKQGGRISNALGDPELFKHMIEELVKHSEGYAQKVSDARMSGFDGAMSRFEGSGKNLASNVGRAWDNGGDEKGGELTAFVNILGEATQALAELPPATIRLLSGFTALAGGLTGLIGAASILGKLTGATSLATGAALGGGAAAVGLGGAILSNEAFKVVKSNPEAFLSLPDDYGLAAGILMAGKDDEGAKPRAAGDHLLEAAQGRGIFGREKAGATSWRGWWSTNPAYHDREVPAASLLQAPSLKAPQPRTSTWTDERGNEGERGRIGARPPVAGSDALGNLGERGRIGAAGMPGKIEATLSPDSRLEATVKPDQIQANVKPDQITAKVEGTIGGTITVQVEGGGRVVGNTIGGTGIAAGVGGGFRSGGVRMPGASATPGSNPRPPGGV